MPTISVIVPVYKVESYLDRCVDSVLAQTYADFELILVDDGSPDSCGAMCDEYVAQDKRIHAIHKPNGGLSDARNAGIDWAFANSDSQWLTFIDSDDWVHPKYLELLLNAAEEHKTSVSVCGFCKPTVYCEPEQLAEPISSLNVSPECLWSQNNVNATVAWGKLYDKQLFHELRFPAGKLHEDEFTTYKALFSCGTIAMIEEALYCYFQNPAGIMQTRWSPRNLDALEAFEEQIAYFKSENYLNAYEYSVRNYIIWCIYNLKQVEAQNEGQNCRRYKNAILKRLRAFLVRHRKEISYGANQKAIDFAFPLFSNIYRAGSRIKRFVRGA